MADQSSPMRASCHCGALSVEAPRVPEYINHCQCTICRRYGAAWAYYRTDEVKVESKPDAVTKRYIWGDKGLSFNFCDHCGCVLYWWPLKNPSADGKPSKMGVNTSNVNPEALRTANRTYEYSALREPLSSKEEAHQEDLAEY